MSKTDLAYWDLTDPFPIEWWTPFNICYKQQGKVEEFTASSMSIHPHQCPFPTVLLWSFSALLFWSMYADCVRQLHSEEKNPRPLPTPIVVTGTSCTQTSQVSHYNRTILIWHLGPGDISESSASHRHKLMCVLWMQSFNCSFLN